MKQLSVLILVVVAACGAASTTTAGQRPAPASPWIGLTSFDLGVRLEAGDRRWVDMMAREGFTVARVVVASTARTRRTLEDGLRQLPITLSTLAAAGLRAEVIVNCDTRELSLDREAVIAHTRRVNTILTQHSGAVAGVQLNNQNTHGVEIAAMSDPTFLRQLETLIDPQFPVSWGGWHDDHEISGGSYVTIHADRDQSPEVNADWMAAQQRRLGKPVIDDEPLGIAEPDAVAGRQRTDDPDYARRLAVEARRHGLAGVTLHIDAGLAADVDTLGPVQRDAMRRFVAAMRER
jgi:hypothetical protein